MRRLLAVLAVTAAALFSSVVPASASPSAVAQPVPPASALCAYIAYNEVNPVANYQVLFAQYETLTPVYAEARCLVAWPVSGAYLVCGFRARVYSNGSWSGPYGLVCS